MLLKYLKFPIQNHHHKVWFSICNTVLSDCNEVQSEDSYDHDELTHEDNQQKSQTSRQREEMTTHDAACVQCDRKMDCRDRSIVCVCICTDKVWKLLVILWRMDTCKFILWLWRSWKRLRQYTLFAKHSSWSSLFWIILISLETSERERRHERIIIKFSRIKVKYCGILWWSVSSTCPKLNPLLTRSSLSKLVTWRCSVSWSFSYRHSTSRVLFHIILDSKEWSNCNAYETRSDWSYTSFAYLGLLFIGEDIALFTRDIFQFVFDVMESWIGFLVSVGQFYFVCPFEQNIKLEVVEAWRIDGQHVT